MMNSNKKFHTWITLLLVWNAALLLVIIALLLLNGQSRVDVHTIAAECATQAQIALEDQCLVTTP